MMSYIPSPIGDHLMNWIHLFKSNHKILISMIHAYKNADLCEFTSICSKYLGSLIDIDTLFTMMRSD